MKLNHKTGTVSLKCRMLAVSIVMCLSAFGMITPTTVAAAETVNEVGSGEVLPPAEDFQDFFEVEGPWLIGNITVDDGSIPESVTIMFSNQRTGENAVEIAGNGTYRFSLQNFTQGYEVGDEVYIEALENTGNGKINTGEVTVTITDTDEMWADIILVDPPFELVPPEPIPGLNSTSDNSTEPNPDGDEGDDDEPVQRREILL